MGTVGDYCCKISITLINPKKGEQTAQAGLIDYNSNFSIASKIELLPPPQAACSTHSDRHVGASKGSAKYWVSWMTLPFRNSMMLTV
jgi:hypothetical protein